MGRYLAPILLFSPPPLTSTRTPDALLLSFGFYFPFLSFLLQPPLSYAAESRAFVAPRLFFGTLVNR